MLFGKLDCKTYMCVGFFTQALTCDITIYGLLVRFGLLGLEDNDKLCCDVGPYFSLLSHVKTTIKTISYFAKRIYSRHACLFSHAEKINGLKTIKNFCCVKGQQGLFLGMEVQTQNFREENNVEVDWFFYLSHLYIHTNFLTPTNTWLWLCVCVWVCGRVYVCKLLTQFSRMPSEVCVVTGLKTVCCPPPPGQGTWLSWVEETLAEKRGGSVRTGQATWRSQRGPRQWPSCHWGVRLDLQANHWAYHLTFCNSQ